MAETLVLLNLCITDTKNSLFGENIDLTQSSRDNGLGESNPLAGHGQKSRHTPMVGFNSSPFQPSSTLKNVLKCNYLWTINVVSLVDSEK